MAFQLGRLESAISKAVFDLRTGREKAEVADYLETVMREVPVEGERFAAEHVARGNTLARARQPEAERPC